MITTDTHAHTLYSHGADTVLAMADAAKKAGLKVFGFTEHSPRPAGCDYPFEYRERLAEGFPRYVEEVKALRAQAGGVDFLFGLEVDWIDGELPFMQTMVEAEDYDYLLGSVHFLGRWPIDWDASSWKVLTEEECFEKYATYFRSLRAMAESRLFHIAAHPDLVKIYSVSTFRRWIKLPESRELVREALVAIRDSGMSMEISAAGLRKPCEEIYPGPEIMTMAAELGVPVSFASDAHATGHVGWKFDQLAEYGRRFGYATVQYFKQRQPVIVEF